MILPITLMMIQVLLFLTFFTFADSVDQIQSGRFTDKTMCGLCGGTILCGALTESIQLEESSGTDSKSVVNLCFLKASALQTIAKHHRPWISEENKRFSKISNIVVKIST